MARIQITDLPVLRQLTKEEQKEIVGGNNTGTSSDPNANSTTGAGAFYAPSFNSIKFY